MKDVTHSSQNGTNRIKNAVLMIGDLQLCLPPEFGKAVLASLHSGKTGALHYRGPSDSDFVLSAMVLVKEENQILHG